MDNINTFKDSSFWTHQFWTTNYMHNEKLKKNLDDISVTLKIFCTSLLKDVIGLNFTNTPSSQTT